MRAGADQRQLRYREDRGDYGGQLGKDVDVGDAQFAGGGKAGMDDGGAG